MAAPNPQLQQMTQGQIAKQKERDKAQAQWRTWMDRYLESQGLLNYQTQGMSQQDIAARYQGARLNAPGGVQPQTPQGQQTQPAPQQFRPSGLGGGATGGTASFVQQPTTPDQTANITVPWGTFIGQVNTPLDPVRKSIYQMAGNYGMTVTEPPKNLFATEDQFRQGQAGWQDIAPEERKAILGDPNFRITDYPLELHQQIIADPDFDWSKLPKWQKVYYTLSSNAPGMGAVQGATLGAFGGPTGMLAGGALGGALGYVAYKTGYDPTQEFWQQQNVLAGAFGAMNWAVEQLEKGLGFGAQAIGAATGANDLTAQELFTRETWQAGGSFFEAVSPSLAQAGQQWKDGKLTTNDALKIMPGVWSFATFMDLILNPEKYKGLEHYLGSADPVELGNTFYERMNEARDRIAKGEDYRRVMIEMQTGIIAQVGDMVGQAVFDPLNVMPQATNKVLGRVAEAQGDIVATRSFSETSAPFEAARRYKTLVQAGDVPAGYVDNMGSLGRFVAGLNEQGQMRAGMFTQRGLLDAPAKPANMWGRFKDNLAALTPEARAREGATMFYDNVGALLSTMDDPAQVTHFLKTLGNSDMKLWRDMGGKIANSPEWYTILPALKAFDTAKLDGLAAAWELAGPQRDGLLKLADVLGEEPGRFIEDLAKRGTAEQDFQRVVDRLRKSNSPQARELLGAVERGEFTPQSLKGIVDAFTGEGALYWHPDQFKAAVLDAMGTHFDEWAVQRLGLEGEAKSGFFRTTHLLKSAQSVLLLGGSPGYALQNGLSGMVHRAATGVYGYMTSRQIDAWLDRFGARPARLEEGVGIGGMVEQATTRTSVKTEAITQAVRGKGNDGIGKAQNFVSSVARGMPFNKLSSWFERVEGKNAYMLAMRDMWGKTWRRGQGFREMTPELRAQLQNAGINPGHVYALIEAGMSKAEIERNIFGRQTGLLARSLVNDAAQKQGIPASQAAHILEKLGVLDELDASLTNANTADKVRQAFKHAVTKAQDFNDMQTARDLQAMAEDVQNKLGAEGAPAALDVIQRTNSNYFDTWLEHYARFGEMFEDLREIPDMAVRNKAIEMNYQISDAEFRRINARTAANYQAIFDTWGRSQNPHAMQILASLAQQDAAMKRAYDFMRQTRREYFDTYSGSEPGDLAAQAAWFDGQARIDTEFALAFEQKGAAERAMGDAMGNLYEEMYGPAAGEAARKWWEDYTRFSADIVKREKKFRSSLAGLDKDAREAAKAKYYGEDKVYQIAELERINQEGIRRLEKVIKNSGQQGQGGTPTAPTPPPTSPLTPAAQELLARVAQEGAATMRAEDVLPIARENGVKYANRMSAEQMIGELRKQTSATDEINQLLAAAEQRKQADIQAKSARRNMVYEVANTLGRYDPNEVQSYYRLVNTLKREDLGGIPDLNGLYDERVTPEFVRDVLSKHEANKAAEAQADAARREIMRGEARKMALKTTNKDTSLLRAIRQLGGIDISLKDIRADIGGDVKGWQPGVFSKKGKNRWGIDELARILAEENQFPIDLNNPADPGGVNQLMELMRRERAGEKIYPTTHDYDAEIIAAENTHYDNLLEEAGLAEEFDAAGWQAGLDQAVRDGDLTALYERIGEMPEQMEGTAPTGEAWVDYVSRIADETAARVEADARDYAIAEAMVRAEEAQAEMQARGEAAVTRQIFRERLQEAFGLTDEQVNAYMEMSDAVAGWYQRTTGESADQFYTRYYEDIRNEVVNADGEQLYQLQPINRRLNAGEVENYARALSRDEAELRRAIRNEPERADRVAILNAVHKLDPKLAETVAKGNMDVLFQDGQYIDAGTGLAAKGAVTFDADGIRATIHAFEAGDFSTVIHENAHVYRRMLTDVVSRVGDSKLKADLTTIEEWAGVKDGQWTRDAEEKFARGFEKYVTDGQAPTPKLRQAFENFKRWMLDIYRSITGSAIDVQITPEVRTVFDRLLGQERYGGDVLQEGLQDYVRSRQPSSGLAESTLRTQERYLASLERQGLGDGPQAQQIRRQIEQLRRRVEAEALYQRDFGKPQQKGLFETGEDTPLFSGTPQRAQAETFQPQAQPKQESLFDTAQFIERKKKVQAKVDEIRRKDTAPSLWDYKPENEVVTEAAPAKPADTPMPEQLPGTPEPTPRTPEGLQDFGEKLPGLARKDMPQVFRDTTFTDADITSKPLSELWPKKDVDAIDDPALAAFATTLRDAIPSKPRDSWKMRRWTETVKLFQETMRYVEEKGVDATLDMMRSRPALYKFVDKVKVLRELPRNTFGRVGEVHYLPDMQLYKDGKPLDYRGYAYAEVDKTRILAKDIDELTGKVQEKLKIEKQTTGMKFQVRRKSGGGFFINKDGDPMRRPLKTFDNVDEAFAYIKNNKADLEQAWEGVKEVDNVKETDVRRDENRPRNAQDWRKGRDATPDMFLEEFGFKGVEFGNWVGQGKNIAERQGMVNAVYDALMDLSDVTGIPPRALSLNGTLGLGLGSRGKGGKASAHFETSNVVINLTKTKGAGTFAHEWFHALDNYFARQRADSQTITGLRPEGAKRYGDGNYITYKPEQMMVYRDSRISMSKAQLETQRALHPDSGYYKAENWRPDPKHPEGVRVEVEEKFARLVEALDESPMKKRAEKIDKGQSGYWSDVIERAARSFENYIIYKMQQNGYHNDYLANVRPEFEFMRSTDRYPYLMENELAPVAEAFDELFQTFQTRETPEGTTMLFQEADKPFGTMDNASGFKADGEWMDEGYRQHVRPLLDAMQETAIERLNTQRPMDGAFRDMSPEGQRMLQNYIKGVQEDMGAVKLSTMKWGESQRDHALLNYNRRYGFDKYLEVIAPYQFFYTRSLMTWGMRALDKPSWYANYARLRNQQNRYERDIPERLRNKIKIDAPWMPDWMGDALYIDPLANLFTPANFLRPFETMMRDKNYQMIETERILQEWAEGGTASQDEILRAVQTRDGSLWERAQAEAEIRREAQIASPFDFMATMFGPAWYLSTPLNLLGQEVPFLSKGDPNKVSSTPLLNTTRAFETVTKGTWAEPIGQLIGLAGKPEQWLREKQGLPEFGEYGEYYVDRQIANMVADGLITSQQAQVAMIERQGDIFEQARERVKMELAMRVPLMGTVYAATHEGLGAGAQAFLPSLFGSGLLPAGELEYRGLKDDWNAAWKKYDAGDKQAVTRFFEDNPEYEAYLAKGKEPQERLRSFMIGNIWDAYMALGETDKKLARQQMGGDFADNFLNKETRNYESVDLETLTSWSQMLGALVPRTEQTMPQIKQPAPALDLYDPQITVITDRFFTERKEKFKDYYTLQQGYYALPKSDRPAYLARNPSLKAYWDWKNKYYDTYPDLVPIFNGQAFKTVDTSAWPPNLEEYVAMYAMTGKKLPKGAYKSLEQVWIREGMPMGDFQSWLDGQVVPAMLYAPAGQ